MVLETKERYGSYHLGMRDKHFNTTSSGNDENDDDFLELEAATTDIVSVSM